MKFLVGFVLLPIGFCFTAEEWSYLSQDAWPASCKGSSQSPIDISLIKTEKSYFEEFRFSPEFYQKKNATLTNTGHSVEVKFSDNVNPPVVQGGGLEGEYVLVQFHFHWGAEHKINGYRYPLEGHFVFYSKKHENFEIASNTTGGLAVLGIFYDIQPVFNPAFHNIANSMPTIARSVNKPTDLQRPIAASDFFPINTKIFLRYNGSLTTPDCNEVVVWTLFLTPSSLSKNEYFRVTHIRDAEGRQIKRNYRRRQNLNGRTVLLAV